MKEENKWFWKVKRKMAPLFAELFVEGLNGKGFEEILPFPSKYQAIKGDKNNFGDIFYKEQDIKEVYDITNKAVKQNENFSKQFNKVSNKIFKRINQFSKKVIGQNLKAYNNKQLLKIYKQFYNSFTAGPIITIQLFAIEAMTNEDSELVTSCKKICLGKNLNFNKIIQDLQISVKETTLYTLRKDLLKICIMIKKKNEKTEKISNEFLKKYFWIDKNLIGKLPIVSTNNRITAYLDRIVNVKEFNFEDLSKLIKKELAKNIEKEYDVHKTYFQKISKERSNSINKLTPNKKLIQLINSMNTFIEQRDFSKREYVKALFSFNKLLIEISSRYKLCKEDLIYYSPKELLKLLEKETFVAENKILERRNGWLVISEKDIIKIISGKELLTFLEKKENLELNLKTKEKTNSLKGRIVSSGKVSGNVRIINNAEDIKKFKQGEIIVANSINLKFHKLFSKAAGIIVDEGGATSHAAIFAREFKIPCIIGTVFATKILKTGQEVKIDDKKNQILIKN